MFEAYEKEIQQLIPGEIFEDALGYPLKVVKKEILPHNDVPNTIQWARITYETPTGNRMFCKFRKNRKVKVINGQFNK